MKTHFLNGILFELEGLKKRLDGGQFKESCFCHLKHINVHANLVRLSPWGHHTGKKHYHMYQPCA